MPKQYWAASPREEIGEQLTARLETTHSAPLTSEINRRNNRAYQYYYGLDPSGVHATSQVLRGGEGDQLAAVRVNHSRSLVNTLLNLISAPKIVWAPKAVNIDHASLRATDLAAAILEYYWREASVAAHCIRALEESLVFGEGFVLVDWDHEAGDDYAGIEAPVATAPTDGVSVDPDAPAEPFAPTQTIKTGDLRFTNVSAWDVVRDPRKSSYDQLDWVIVRTRRNRYDLMAQYPDQAERIAEAPEDLEDASWSTVAMSDTDDIACFRFFHKPCASMPDGRAVTFLRGDVVLADGPLGYREIPLYRVSAGEIFGTPYPYTPYYDILGVQEVLDSLNTAVTTNQTTFATQNIIMEEGTEIDPSHLAGGINAIYKPPGASNPEALQLTSSPPEVFKYMDTLKSAQELLFGLNSVVRGETPSGEMSGSALALLQSQALQQSSVVQGAYMRMVESIGSCVIYAIQKYASLPRKIALVGKGQQSLVTDAEYSSSDVERIKKVQVEIGNPLAQTSAGRVEIAKDLINALGPGKLTAEQVLQVMETGKLQPLTQSLHNELLLIKSENEALSAGQPAKALAIDDHTLHAREHRAMLASPQARATPEVVQAVLSHLAEHESLYYSVSPQQLLLVGIQPPALPMAPPGGAGPTGGAPPPANGGPPAGDGAPPAIPPSVESAQPSMPNPPKNPTTGRPWNPVDGGGSVPRG